MRFAVVGDPVDHSLSPIIHMAAFTEVGIDAEYTRLRLPQDRFADVVGLLRDGTLDGINATMPHKGNAFHAADRRDALAERMGAVNTVTAVDGVLSGYNTDVAGFGFAFDRLGINAEAPVLILGSGGAARAASVAFERSQLVVQGRSIGRAAEMLEAIQVEATTVPWGKGADGAVVVNTTPIGMQGEPLPLDIIAGASALIDAAYGHGETPAVASMRALGRPVADGIDLLVGQAIDAFELFTGRTAPAETMMWAARRASS